MTKTIETARIKEALELQFTAVKTYASRLSSQDMNELESDLNELEHAVGELRGMMESLPHKHQAPSHTGAPPASPATTRGERVAKGSETADATQRPEGE